MVKALFPYALVPLRTRPNVAAENTKACVQEMLDKHVGTK